MAVLCEFEAGLFSFVRGLEDDFVCCRDLFFGRQRRCSKSLLFICDDLGFRRCFSGASVVSGFAISARILLFFRLPSHCDRLFRRNVQHAQSWPTTNHRHDQLEIAAHLLAARSV